jgi:hypothetical protein
MTIGVSSSLFSQSHSIYRKVFFYCKFLYFSLISYFYLFALFLCRVGFTPIFEFMLFYFSLIYAHHVFDKMLLWILINFLLFFFPILYMHTMCLIKCCWFSLILYCSILVLQPSYLSKRKREIGKTKNHLKLDRKTKYSLD